MPPCRFAAMAIVLCPLCGRQVTTKTLRYTRTGVDEPSTPQRASTAAETSGIRGAGQTREHRVEQRPLQAQPVEHRVDHRPLQAQPVEHRVKYGLGKYQQISTNMPICLNDSSDSVQHGLRQAGFNLIPVLGGDRL